MNDKKVLGLFKAISQWADNSDLSFTILLKPQFIDFFRGMKKCGSFQIHFGSEEYLHPKQVYYYVHWSNELEICITFSKSIYDGWEEISADRASELDLSEVSGNGNK